MKQAVHTKRASTRVYTVYTRRRTSSRQIKLMLKIVSIHTDRVDATRRDALGVNGP